MIDELIKSLSMNLECIDCKSKENQYVFTVASIEKNVVCPYCNNPSSKVHSLYQREIQDLPIQDRQVILLINTRKMFCTNTECSHKTFAEKFDFVDSHGKKTERLVSKILTADSPAKITFPPPLLKASSLSTVDDRSVSHAGTSMVERNGRISWHHQVPLSEKKELVLPSYGL